MFQSLTQGASVSILYRNEPRILTGKVLSVNTHVPVYNPSQPMSVFNGLVTDITVQVGNDTIPFAGLPTNGVVANFQDKGMFLSTDAAAVLREIDNAVIALEQDLATVPEKQKLLDGYKTLRQESNPDAAKEKELADMRNELLEMKQMLSALIGTKEKET